MGRLLRLVLLALVLPVPATATDYYVSAGGHGESAGSPSNGNSCMTAQNIATPKRWFSADGMGAGAVSCLGSGVRLLVRGGTYGDNILGTDIPAGASGTAFLYTKIMAYPNGCSPRAPNPCGTPSEDVTLTGFTYGTSTINIRNVSRSYIEIAGINI